MPAPKSISKVAPKKSSPAAAPESELASPKSSDSDLALWTIEHLQDADGHFYCRDLGWIKVKTPMIHWGQGTMFKAMAVLLSVLRG